MKELTFKQELWEVLQETWKDVPTNSIALLQFRIRKQIASVISTSPTAEGLFTETWQRRKSQN